MYRVYNCFNRLEYIVYWLRHFTEDYTILCYDKDKKVIDFNINLQWLNTLTIRVFFNLS